LIIAKQSLPVFGTMALQLIEAFQCSVTVSVQFSAVAMLSLISLCYCSFSAHVNDGINNKSNKREVQLTINQCIAKCGVKLANLVQTRLKQPKKILEYHRQSVNTRRKTPKENLTQANGNFERLRLKSATQKYRKFANVSVLNWCHCQRLNAGRAFKR